jgi:nucleoside-diphosphate-sugar epimerase/dTDP-4-dehydrorhamnose 3,5-epimerase-like enzyme
MVYCLMRKKIVITGGLGYIGFELCKIYSGISWYFEIIAIDNKFYSSRVNQLKDWNIKFIQADILDKDLVIKYIQDADVIHHLAGITNVAYLKKEEDKNLKNKIEENAIEGTRNILKFSSDKTKIIFPSTHVVFEGLKKKKNCLKEDDSVYPILSYSSSKYINEKDIINSKKKYIILRLGSVYGFSGDATRLSIVPNLFSKITSQDGTLKLFAEGRQLKSLVNIKDVARCFKFFEERDDLFSELYHVSNENVSIKNIANICKKYNKELKIIKTKDDIPNEGYHLSNLKLLNTGFKFLYGLENSIKEMILKWKIYNSHNSKKLEFKDFSKNNFIDKRGSILNYHLTEPINLIGLIKSKKGALRANHYHPIQEQKVLCIKGSYISIFKNLLDPEDNIKTQLVTQGELVVTRPNVAHTMLFLEDSEILNLVNGEREHQNYGITHTIPFTLVNDKLKLYLLKYFKNKCRCCKTSDLVNLISLGLSPLANNLRTKLNAKDELFPLELFYCKNCFNIQLSIVIPPKKMFSNYLYLSSTSKDLEKHFHKAAKQYKEKFKLTKKSKIIDIGSNDGVTIKSFKLINLNCLGVEPSKNLTRIANKNNLKTINGYFDRKILKKINYKSDLILASNVFAHTDEIEEMVDTVKFILKTNGSFIIEVQYALDIFRKSLYDNIYHEHVNYWSLTTLNHFFNRKNMKIYDVEEIKTHGGSLRVFISHKTNKIITNEKVYKMIKYEKNFGIGNFNKLKKISENISNIKYNFHKNLKKIISNKPNQKIFFYGAPAKTTTLFNFLGVNNYNISIIEDNFLKIGRYIPGTNIKIISKVNVPKKDFIIVNAWNYFKKIKDSNKSLSKKFINILDLFN